MIFGNHRITYRLDINGGLSDGLIIIPLDSRQILERILETSCYAKLVAIY